MSQQASEGEYQAVVYRDEFLTADWFPAALAGRFHVDPWDDDTSPEKYGYTPRTAPGGGGILGDRKASPPHDAFRAADWETVLSWGYQVYGWTPATWLYGSLLLSAEAIPDVGLDAVLARWKKTRYPQYRADSGAEGIELLKSLKGLGRDAIPRGIGAPGAALLLGETSDWMTNMKLTSSWIAYRLGWAYAMLDLAGRQSDWEPLRALWLARHPRSKALAQHFHAATRV